MDPSTPIVSVQTKHQTNVNQVNSLTSTPLQSQPTINPYQILSSTPTQSLDYDKLLTRFGCHPINQQLLDRMEQLTGKKVSHLLRRGIFFAHRDLDYVLNLYQNKVKGESKMEGVPGEGVPGKEEVPSIKVQSINQKEQSLKVEPQPKVEPPVNVGNVEPPANKNKKKKQKNDKNTPVEQGPIIPLPPFYLYTGRGPSSDALHLGHLLPFLFTKQLQQAFNVPLVIQITDDEKYFHKEGDKLEDFTKMAYENIKDIVAMGFDPEKTFIFIDTEYMDKLYPNVCRFQKNINLTTLKAIFGLQFADNCGKVAYPAIQAAPCLSSCFPHLFGNKNIPCLIPCGIDQDPYFRMTRDVCTKLKAPKPAGLYSKFFPGLRGAGSKMSASDPTSGIFMTDTPKQIESKIKKFAFSGGRATKQQQQQYGANLTTDVAYAYLTFFCQDDELLAHIGRQYGAGRMLTSDVKKECIRVIQEVVERHRKRREDVTMDKVREFLDRRDRIYPYVRN